MARESKLQQNFSAWWLQRECVLLKIKIGTIAVIFFISIVFIIVRPKIAHQLVVSAGTSMYCSINYELPICWLDKSNPPPKDKDYFIKLSILYKTRERNRKTNNNDNTVGEPIDSFWQTSGQLYRYAPIPIYYIRPSIRFSYNKTSLVNNPITFIWTIII